MLRNLSSSLESLGLRIPTLVLEQPTPRLEKLGVVEWRAGTWFVKNIPRLVSAGPADDVLDKAFDAIEKELAAFAQNLFEVNRPPYSPTWDDAIISFLKFETSSRSPDPGGETKGDTPIVIGTTLVGDTKATERMIVAKFIQECEGDPAKEPVLDCFVQVFTGIFD